MFQGDSGGPLVCEVKIDGKVEKIQYGITSGGGHKKISICGAKEAPGFYTNVAIHRSSYCNIKQ